MTALKLVTAVRGLARRGPATGAGSDSMSSSFAGAYAGKSVFLTGQTGFKGAWLAHWLTNLGAKVHGYALDEPGAPAAHTALDIGRRIASETAADVRDLASLTEALDRARPDFIFHLAAQPLVLQSHADPLETVQTNILGTTHLLEALRMRGQPCAVVVVTSDKCYAQPPGGSSPGAAFRETDPLGGHDVYSASKAACELIVNAYRESFFHPMSLARHGVALSTARAGNVIGGGDYADLRIIPDCVRALVAKTPVRLRHPHARRPWQHVLDPLAGYLALGRALTGPDAASYCEAWNFGPAAAVTGHASPGSSDSSKPEDWTVEQLVARFIKTWGSGTAQAAEKKDSKGKTAPAEAAFLALDSAKARTRLGWTPAFSLVTAVELTARWYKTFEAGGRKRGSMQDFTTEQLELLETRGQLAPGERDTPDGDTR